MTLATNLYSVLWLMFDAFAVGFSFALGTWLCGRVFR